MVFLSIGSNLHSKYGNRIDNISYTLKLLNKESIKILKISSFYETLSYPNNKDPKFINIAVSIENNITVKSLMKIIFKIENLMGRYRNLKNEPRVCDIDIIDYNSKNLIEKYENHEIILPHPRMYLRNFVLYPLKEIAPNWIHPKTKENINILIQKLSDHDKKSILIIKED